MYQWGAAYRGEGNNSNEPVLSLKGKVSARFILYMFRILKDLNFDRIL